ncbi:MAG: amidohydrolase family protein [Blautia sp.]|nr:amidohydrolase family protein [Blautia sp.]
MKYAYRNGIILDGTKNMQPITGKTVLVENEMITDIISDTDDLSGYEVIDLEGCYLLPGMINLHVHIPGTGEPKDKPVNAHEVIRTLTANEQAREILKQKYISCSQIALHSGVTTIRTVGGIENYDAWLRDEINNGKVTGPRVLAGNKAISVPSGHMAGVFAYAAASPEMAREYVRMIAEGKPDLIKLMITGGVMDADESGEPALKMSPEIVKAACDEAHKLGFYVAAHVEGKEGLIVALENGVDTIEHGAKTDDEIIRLFIANHASLVTTISPVIPYALIDTSVTHFDETAHSTSKTVMDGVIECARTCLDNGIPVGLGTDTGVEYITHYDFWRELVYFQKYCDVSNAFAIHTATAVNARIAGVGDETGTIEAGKSADFFVVEKNPLEDLKALRDVKLVAIRGKVIENPEIKWFEKVEQELNKLI